MGDPWIVPVGLHLEPLNRPKPTAFVLAGTPVRWSDMGTVSAVESAVARQLDRIAGHLHRWGEDAANDFESALSERTNSPTSGRLRMAEGI